ncbi:Bgt-50109 [Blumeria graminis f. sp. tritici]|uniref:Bgt-50109 n=1 Tax=Blumeria graminis f. sp. tritici TaxID=62690 RepID=A0A9X9MPV9_BLUGR|nr:Bgt-50109 [Blumeria graminis f. sp. tritici]
MHPLYNCPYVTSHSYLSISISSARS